MVDGFCFSVLYIKQYEGSGKVRCGVFSINTPFMQSLVWQ